MLIGISMYGCQVTCVRHREQLAFNECVKIKVRVNEYEYELMRNENEKSELEMWMSQWICILSYLEHGEQVWV